MIDTTIEPTTGAAPFGSPRIRKAYVTGSRPDLRVPVREVQLDGAGNEPLYKLNANIFQVFVSIWF